MKLAREMAGAEISSVPREIRLVLTAPGWKAEQSTAREMKIGA